MASREIEKERRKEKHSLQRKRPHLVVSPTILIVCEGENTEPSYFNQLKLRSATIQAIGEGYNTLSLVKRAEALAKKTRYDEVWCVFDKDDFAPHDFNKALQIAKTKNIRAVYSNQAFEFWILLHFNNHQGGALHRRRYNEMLNHELRLYGVSYDGNGCKIITSDIFNLMFSKDPQTGKYRNDIAVERAEKIYKRLDHFSPATEESSTTVFMLMKHLMEFSRY
ncbi:MAG: RloB family protein [Sphaerochaeta sp.]